MIDIWFHALPFVLKLLEISDQLDSGLWDVLCPSFPSLPISWWWQFSSYSQPWAWQQGCSVRCRSLVDVATFTLGDAAVPGRRMSIRSSSTSSTMHSTKGSNIQRRIQNSCLWNRWSQSECLWDLIANYHFGLVFFLFQFKQTMNSESNTTFRLCLQLQPFPMPRWSCKAPRVVCLACGDEPTLTA